MDNNEKSLRGTLGEDITALYIERSGFSIAARNYHSRYGEIDIIAVNSEFIIFAEVKTRNEHSLERPAVAVTLAKQRKIIKTALIFLAEHEYDLQPRFDVSEVTLDGRTNALIDLNYIKNAFDAEGY